jgi:prepilin-type N-terminal cleavage/methylation domain-containing protein
MRSNKAFTLVEILIVVVILAILAAVVLPKFSNASAMARASMLADDLRIMRMQIEVYRGQHIGVAPGYPGGNAAVEPTEDAFVAQLTLASNAFGETAPINTPSYHYGPYMRGMPTNPVNGKTTVHVLPAGQALPDTGDNSHGWIFQPSPMALRADCSESDSTGKLYYNY